MSDARSPTALQALRARIAALEAHDTAPRGGVLN